MNLSIIELLILFGILYWIYDMVKLGMKKRDRKYNEADTEIIQELHRGMEKMATRIESLETILLDQGEHYRRMPPPMPSHDHEEVR